MIFILESLDVMPSKQDLFNQIELMIKQYGKLKTSKALTLAFIQDGYWYKEDKRKSGVDFAKEIINSNYHDNVPNDVSSISINDASYYHYDNNKDVLKALEQSQEAIDNNWI